MQVRRYWRVVWCLAAVMPASASAQTRDADSEAAVQVQNAAIDIYGFLFGQLAIESRRTGRDRFLNIQPMPGTPGVEDRGGDAFFDVLASRVGLNVRDGGDGSPEVFGNLEIDFDTPTGGPRIRHAYGELAVGRWRVLAGQTWPVVSQLNPATINSDNLFNLGNAYERVPQFRVSYQSDLDPGTLEIQLGALTFFGVFDQGNLAIQTNPAAAESMALETNTPPVLQGRMRFGWDSAGRQGQVAVGISGGRFETCTPSGMEHGGTHFLITGEVLVPFTSSVEFMAEAFHGNGGGFNSGVGQTGVVTAAGLLQPVNSWGGFAQLNLAPNSAISLNAIAGLDDPETRPGGTSLTIGRNWSVLGNVFWNVTERLSYAVELQFLRTEYEAMASTAENVRATIALFLQL